MKRIPSALLATGDGTGRNTGPRPSWRGGRSGPILATVALLVASIPPVAAVSFYLSPDVPTTLGAATFQPWEIARNDSGVYGSTLLLPLGTPIDAMSKLSSFSAT